MSSSTAIPDAADIFEVQQDSEWQIAIWKASDTGGMAIYHHRGCGPCSMYATHLMAAFNDSNIKLPKRVLGEAIEKAWLSLFHDIEDMEEERWQHCLHLLKDNVSELKDSLA